MAEEQQPLSLIPQLIPDPNMRRQRENERRIEEFVKRLLADQKKDRGSYARRFLGSE